MNDPPKGTISNMIGSSDIYEQFLFPTIYQPFKFWWFLTSVSFVHILMVLQVYELCFCLSGLYTTLLLLIHIWELASYALHLKSAL